MRLFSFFPRVQIPPGGPKKRKTRLYESCLSFLCSFDEGFEQADARSAGKACLWQTFQAVGISLFSCAKIDRTHWQVNTDSTLAVGLRFLFTRRDFLRATSPDERAVRVFADRIPVEIAVLRLNGKARGAEPSAKLLE